MTGIFQNVGSYGVLSMGALGQTILPALPTLPTVHPSVPHTSSHPFDRPPNSTQLPPGVPNEGTRRLQQHLNHFLNHYGNVPLVEDGKLGPKTCGAMVLLDSMDPDYVRQHLAALTAAGLIFVDKDHFGYLALFGDKSCTSYDLPAPLVGRSGVPVPKGGPNHEQSIRQPAPPPGGVPLDAAILAARQESGTPPEYVPRSLTGTRPPVTIPTIPALPTTVPTTPPVIAPSPQPKPLPTIPTVPVVVTQPAPSPNPAPAVTTPPAKVTKAGINWRTVAIVGAVGAGGLLLFKLSQGK